MTVIVGLIHEDQVHIGGDSAGVAGCKMTIRKDPKTFLNGPYTMGFCGSFRMGQLLHHAFKAPTPKGDLDRFMTTKFVNKLRACLKTAGWARKESEQEQGGTFLVGIYGRLFIVYSDYQVAEPADGYAAVGCGNEFALGALHATETANLGPRERLTVALTAASHHGTDVSPPFTYATAPSHSKLLQIEAAQYATAKVPAPREEEPADA
ncbi:hypothetical protein [Streptomyces olivoreticuli]|uniref:hypothetical protein n=1 Tax=Streptomyces olivoreticuli TaxID=68246 RepID=UPI001F08539F|nr:hypothetical protein [Streptomyces olivoreticuli]